MKTMRLFLVLFASLAFFAGLSAQTTLTGYGVIKTHYLTQTTSSAPVNDSYSPYGLSAYVFGTGSLGAYTYSFTPPAGSGVAGPVVLNNSGNQADFQSDATPYATTVALNLAYNDGAFTMSLPNNGGSGNQSATLPSASGDAYPNAPTVGGIWAGGMLQVDPTQNYNLNFTAFSGATFPDDSINMNINNISGNYFSNSSVTTFLITANTLTAGQVYDVSLRFNNNFIDMGTSIAGANGNSGYTTEVDFQIQAIPEPSTYAAIFGVLALGGVMVQRRRRTA